MKNPITSLTGAVYPVMPGNKYKKGHAAIDISCPLGTPLTAPGDGHMINSHNDLPYGGLVMSVVIYKTALIGRHTLLFRHLSKIPFTLKAGTKFKKGDVIAYTGNSGFLDKAKKKPNLAHLHLEILKKETDRVYSTDFNAHYDPQLFYDFTKL